MRPHDLGRRPGLGHAIPRDQPGRGSGSPRDRIRRRAARGGRPTELLIGTFPQDREPEFERAVAGAISGEDFEL